MPKKVLAYGDSKTWLAKQKRPLKAFLTTLPTGPLMTQEGERNFFECAKILFEHLDAEGFAIFFQQEHVKSDDTWLDTCGLLSLAALARDVPLLWRKLIITESGEPKGHVSCYSRVTDRAPWSPEIFSSFRDALADSCKFLKLMGATYVVDPFCNKSESILQLANAAGLDAFGVKES